jgi:polar amino acid transport system substrate-binding protein
MKTFKSIFAAIAALAVLGAIQSASAETLRVGTECTYHPFNYRDSDGNLQGYDVDVGNEVGKRIGAEIEWVCQKWDGMIPALLANKFDLIAASMSITNKRLKSIDFSAPYRVSIGQMIGGKGKGYEFFNADGSVNEAGFSGVRIGLERATTYDEWFKAKVPNAEIAYYDSNEAMYLDLQAGRVDVIMTNPMKAFLRFLSKPDGAGFEVVGPQVAEEEYFGIGVGIALRKGNDDLKARISAAIIDMGNDGSLEKFSRKIFPFTIHPLD